MAKATNNKIRLVKRYIKLLALVSDPSQQKILIKRSPDSVIKSICDAALNAQKGDVSISRQKKKRLANQRNLFSKLTNRKVSILKKRKFLVQRGGLAILPILLSTVLGSLGSLLFSK